MHHVIDVAIGRADEIQRAGEIRHRGGAEIAHLHAHRDAALSLRNRGWRGRNIFNAQAAETDRRRTIGRAAAAGGGDRRQAAGGAGPENKTQAAHRIRRNLMAGQRISVGRGDDAQRRVDRNRK